MMGTKFIICDFSSVHSIFLIVERKEDMYRPILNIFCHIQQSFKYPERTKITYKILLCI